jgi:hypothetical protein
LEKEGIEYLILNLICKHTVLFFRYEYESRFFGFLAKKRLSTSDDLDQVQIKSLAPKTSFEPLTTQNRPHEVSCNAVTHEVFPYCRNKNNRPVSAEPPRQFDIHKDKPPRISLSATSNRSTKTLS